ncbi:MAG: ABC transporter permease [Planctomycetota bacterium]
MIERLRQLWAFRELVRNLVRVNLLVKYRGSVLGLLWSLLNPLMLMLIYVIAFKYIIRLELENYTFFLLIGLLPWTFFSASVVGATICVIENGSLLKKVRLPREVFPFSNVAFQFVHFVLAMLVFVPFTMVWKDTLLWSHLLVFPVLLLFLAFTLGVSLALSALTVLYRDLKHFTEIGVALFFWVTPIVYNFELVPEGLRPWFQANPVTLYMNCFHDLLYWDRMPEIGALLGVVAWPVATLLIGSAVFIRIEPLMAERV